MPRCTHYAGCCDRLVCDREVVIGAPAPTIAPVGPSVALHPFCMICGWRRGGKDSWDGQRCKCGLSSSPIVVEVA